MAQEISRVVEDGVALITLNRPERYNAMNVALLEQLLDALSTYANDREIGCVVVTGSGRGFCSGGDMRDQAASATAREPLDLERSVRQLRRLADASRLLHEMGKPTIAMLNGVAAGAGMSLALACDLRIAGESARMTTAFAKVGRSGDYGGVYFLNRLVGPAKARELYFTSEILDARQLQALGLVSRVVTDDELVAECMGLARQLAEGPRVVWSYMKRNFKAADHLTLADYLDVESDGMVRTGQTLDHKEAAVAFIEKRKPVFQGR